MCKRDTETSIFCFVSCKDNESLPVDDGVVIPDHKDSEEENADERTYRDSLIPHEAQGNGREGSLEGSKRGEGLIDGFINHIYEKPTDKYVPSFLSRNCSHTKKLAFVLKTRARTW